MTLETTAYPKAVAHLLGNRKSLEGKGVTDIYTPPSREHYPHTWLWDGAFHAIVFAHFDYPDLARDDISAILKGQNEKTGFIPNMRFGPGRTYDPERFTFLDPTKSSDYTQPPVLANAAWETYQSYRRIGRKEDGQNFLKQTYNPLRWFYEYFKEIRPNPYHKDLIDIIHPHETGRDSDWVYDQKKPFLPQSHLLAAPINTATDYIASLKLNLELKSLGWDAKKALENGYRATDVMFNCLYSQNLDFMSQIARALNLDKDAIGFKNQAELTEKAILESMWNPADRQFYNLDRTGAQIKRSSVGSLFPLVLPNIFEDQLQSQLDLLNDPNWYGTPFPIPSIPVNSPSFDPDYKMKRIWRAGVWINMNWYIANSLEMQGDLNQAQNPELAKKCFEISDRIQEKTLEMTDTHGYWEFYHPITGLGQRIQNLGWSTLAETFRRNI